MSNSNGMYRVLDIFKKLEPTQEQQVKAEAKRIYESVEAKGSILEGVKTTEQKLQEKYAGFKESWDPADVADHVRNCIQKIHDEASNGVDMTDYIADELNDVFSDVRRSKDSNLKKAYAMMQDAADSSPEQQASVASNALKMLGGLAEERETLKTKTGTIYKGGSYGTEYDGNDDKKKPKHVPKTGQKGRPKKDPAPVYSKINDPFGRVPDKAPKGKKGTVIKGKGNIDTVDEDNINEISDQTMTSLAQKRATQSYDQMSPATKRKDVMTHLSNVAKPHERSMAKKPTTEVAKNPYAVGMAQAMKSTGDKPPLKKSTITKAHDIAKKVKVNEGVNFSEMVKKHTVTLDEMMKQLSDDIMEFKRSGHVSDTLKDCMSVYEYGKQQLTDSEHTKHALDLNPDLKRQAQPPKPTVLGKVGDLAKKGLDVLTGPDDEELMRDLARRMYNEEDELNELARLAGLSINENKKKVEEDDIEEGPEIFKLKADAAKKAGEKTFQGPDGKTYPVKEGTMPGAAGKDELARTIYDLAMHLHTSDRMYAQADPAGEARLKQLQAQWDKSFPGEDVLKIGKVASDTAGQDRDDRQRMQSTLQKARQGMSGMYEASKPDYIDLDNDGNKKETMKNAAKDAEEEKVNECMSPMGSMASDMDRQQGKISVNTNMSSDGHKSVNINADGDAAEELMQMLKAAGIGSEQAQKHIQLVIAKPQGAEEEMAEATGQYANTPEEEYEGVDAIVNQGDDMNRQKRQFADKPRAGDNPMATPESIDPVAELGRNLMQEYESLKLAK